MISLSEKNVSFQCLFVIRTLLIVERLLSLQILLKYPNSENHYNMQQKVLAVSDIADFIILELLSIIAACNTRVWQIQTLRLISKWQSVLNIAACNIASAEW